MYKTKVADFEYNILHNRIYSLTSNLSLFRQKFGQNYMKYKTTFFVKNFFFFKLCHQQCLIFGIRTRLIKFAVEKCLYQYFVFFTKRFRVKKAKLKTNYLSAVLFKILYNRIPLNLFYLRKSRQFMLLLHISNCFCYIIHMLNIQIRLRNRKFIKSRPT